MDKMTEITKAFQPKPGNPRLMKYPYTLGAQIALFPYKFYFQKQWIFRYTVFGSIGCIPLFMWISKQVNSPGNVAKWKEIRQKELLEHHYLGEEH